jgi:hypothetical protein
MRRAVLVLVLVAAATVTPAGVMLATSSAAGAAPAGPRVQADFNGDNAEDLAVGVPFESVGTVDLAGAVNVLYGGQPRLAGAGSQLFTQATTGIGSDPEFGDNFGEAVAVGDFDGDGIDDLAVGAPGESVGTVDSAGAVNVIFGSSAGLNHGRPSQLFTQNNLGVGRAAGEFDFFGEALAAGDLDGDGAEDLAIGAPDANVGSAVAAGLVDVVYGSAAGLQGGRASQIFTQNSPGVGSDAEELDLFGSALAAGDVNGSGQADLAVGVPTESVGTVEGAGAVNVLFGGAGGLTGSGQLIHQGTTGVVSDPETFDEFGFSLDAGDFDANGQADLAVGVPFESVGAIDAAGAVNVLYGSGAGLAGTGSQLFHQDSTGVGSDAESGDQFGVSVAAGDFDGNGSDDLAVGVPFEAVGSVGQAGAINVLYGGQPRLAGAGSQLFHQGTTGIGSDPELLDGFGFALAVGDFDASGAADLAVGAPGESVGTVDQAGAINVLYGGQPRLAGAGSQLFHQGTTGIGSDPEPGDEFGFALAAPGSQSAGAAASSSTTSRAAGAGGAETTPAAPFRAFAASPR